MTIMTKLVAIASLLCAFHVLSVDPVSAECRIRTDIPTYAAGQLKDQVCDENGSTFVVLRGQAGGEHVDPNNEEGGYQRVQPRAGTVGAADVVSHISVGSTEDEHAVCTADCTVYSISATNTNAAVRYLKCFNNVAASTTPGTSTPVLRMAIPGATTGGGFAMPFPVGVSFTPGLTCWIVTGAADSDVAEVAANELMINYSRKQ